MAIAYDTSASGNIQNGNPLTFSHTCTGINLVLLVSVTTATATATAPVTGITYNGTAMTQIASQAGSGHEITYLYYLIAPTTGAHNVVVTTSNSNAYISACSASYTGADQTTQPNAFAQANSYTETLSVVSSASWIVAAGGGDSGFGLGGTMVAGSGFTLRSQQVGTSVYSLGLEDSNGTVSSGNHTVAMTIMNYQGYTYYPSSIIAAEIKDQSIARTLTALVGTFALTGYNITIGLGHGIIAGVGSFALTGYSVLMNQAKHLFASVGTFSLTGYNAVLSVGHTIFTSTGKFILTGYNATLSGPFHTIWTEYIPAVTSWVKKLTGQ